MVNPMEKEKNKIQSKFNKSATWSCLAVLLLVSMWSKSLIIEMAKLKLYQRQVYNTINKQEEDYMANYKQQEDDMAIYKWLLYHMVSSKLHFNSIVLYRQQVDFMAAFLANFLAQHFIYTHHHMEAFMSLVFSLSEYRHFQGSWSVPRRSGSQAIKFWLMVGSSKLGHMQESYELVKDAQKVVEKKKDAQKVVEKKQDAQEHKLSFSLGRESAELDGFPARHVFLHKLAESFPLPWLDLAESFFD